MKRKILATIKDIILSEPSAHKLALAISLGVFCALSPFIGLHTAMAIGLSFIFRVNMPLTVAILYLVSNPWTMVPLLIADYAFGHWFFYTILGINLMDYNPSWMGYINRYLESYTQKYMGLHGLSLWELILGGTILALITAIISYPIARRILRKYENNHAK